MRDQILSFTIGVLFATIVCVAYINKSIQANAGADHYLLTLEECLNFQKGLNVGKKK